MMQRSLTDAAQQLICNQQVVGSSPTAGWAQYQGLTQFHHLSGNTALSHFLATFLDLAAIARLVLI
jgi:hypothetical protein